MPGPGYKRKKLPGPSKVGRRGGSKGAIAEALGAVGGSSKDLGKGFRHAAKSRERHATRAVTKYAAGDKSFKPTLEQFRSAWPDLPKSVQDKLGPEILARARSEISPEFGPKGDNARPRPLPKFLRKYDPKGFDAYNRAIPGATAVRESQAETDKAFNNDLGRAVEAGLLVAPMGGVLRVGKLGIDAIRAARVGKAAKATEEAATAGRAAKVAETAGEGTVKQATRAGKVAEAAKGTRAARAAKATTAAAKESKVLRGTRAALDSKAGRVAVGTAKVGTAPIRKPITRGFPLYAGSSGALAAAQGDDPLKAIADAATGKPTEISKALGSFGGSLEDKFGIIGAAAADALELPVAVVPSLYLLGKGLVEKAAGDSTELDKQLQGLQEHSLAGVAYKGLTGEGWDWEQAKNQLLNHPLYSALELSGAESVLGRSAGAATRALSGGKLAGRERGPLTVGGDQQAIPRTPYSPDLFKQAIQKARDRRRSTDEQGNPMATEGEIQKAVGAERPDRMVGGNEGARTKHRTEELNDTIRNAPKRTKLDLSDRRKAIPPKKMNDATLDAAGSVYVNAGGIMRNAATFVEDLRNYGKLLDRKFREMQDEEAAAADTAGSRVARLKSDQAWNRYNRELVDELIKRGDPERIFATARANAEHLNKKTDPERIRQGLDPDQALRARLINPATIHLGAKQGKPVEQVAARREWEAKPRRAKESRREVDRARERKARIDREHQRSQGRLERLEAQANVYRRRLGRQESALRREIADKGLTRTRSNRLSEIERKRQALDRNPKSMLNRERGRLTDLEGRRIEADANMRLAKHRAEQARRAAMGKNRGPKPAVTEQLVDAEGRGLSNERILRELQDQKLDPDLLAHTSLAPHQTTRNAMYVPGSSRPQVTTGKRLTGEAISRGAFDPSYETMISNRVGKRGKIDATNAWDGYLQEFSGVPRDRRTGERIELLDGSQARDAVASPDLWGLEELPGQDWVAVRAFPFLTKNAEGARALELQAKDYSRSIEDQVEGLTALDNALSGKIEGAGPFKVIPRTTALRLRQHFAPPSPAMKVFQMVNQTFKQTVLTLSLKWIPGNFLSVNMRTLMSGHLPPGLTFNIGGRRLRSVAARTHERAMEIDPYAADRSEATIGHGTHITNVGEQIIHRSAEDLPGRRLPQVAAWLGDSRFGSALHKYWKQWTQAVFAANERLVENPVVKQNFGAALVKELDTNLQVRFKLLLKLSDEIIDNLARGYLDPANSIKLAKVVEETTGQWTGNSPMARTLLSGYAPFGMWTRAATTYVLYTLPFRHPIKTAILANIEQMTLDERKALGLSVFADRPMPPGSRGMIPLPNGSYMPVSTMSDFGYFDNYGGNLAGTVLPYASGSLEALRGVNVFGGRLENADGTPMDEAHRAVWAGLQLMGATVPFVGKTESTLRNSDEGIGQALLGQVPFTNASLIDPGLASWLRDQAGSQLIDVPAKGAEHGTADQGSSSTSAPSLPPWYKGSSTSGSSSSGASLPPWYKTP